MNPNVNHQKNLNDLDILLNKIPGSFYWKNEDGLFLGCNDSFLQSIGLSSKEAIVGKTAHELWPNEAKKHKKHDKIVMESKISHCFEETIPLPRNRKKYFTVFKMPLFNDSGVVIGVIANSLSTTSAKNLQIQLAQSKKATEKENKILHNVISSVPGSIYWKNKEGVYLGCNDFMVKTAGLNSAEDIIGKSDFELWPNQAVTFLENDKNVIQLEHAVRIEEQVDLKNGKKRYFTVEKIPLNDGNGNIIGIVGNSIEITELKNTQSALEAASKAKSQFIANMSHDIRTPLSGIVGMSELLEESAQSESDKIHARLINESGHQLLNLLNNILDMVKADKVNEHDLNVKTIDLRETLKGLIQLEKPSTEIKGLSIELKIDEPIPNYIKTDRTKLHRILLNLMGNAIKFTDEGKVGIEVKLISKSKEKATLQFRVIDTGIGIPEDKQSQVFERFFRAHPSFEGKYSGHGVGLNIAQSYANLLGGEIKLTSTPGVGTIFYFDLSFDIGKKSEVEDNDEIMSPRPEKFFDSLVPLRGTQLRGATATTPKILLVEDNTIALKMVENFAVKCGCQYVLARSAEEAIKLIQSDSFDLIITDIGLPGISGQEMTQIIRDWESSTHKPPIPIIGLTAHAGEGSLPSGMNGIYTKPITMNLMKKILAEFLIRKNQNNKKTKAINTKQALHLSDLPEIEEEFFKLKKYPLFSIKSAIKNIGNEQTTEETLQLMSHQEIVNDLSDIKKAYAKKDWDKIGKIAHRMKASALYCGTIRMKYACQYLERYLKTGQTKLLKPLYQQLIEIVEGTQKRINQWLND